MSGCDVHLVQTEALKCSSCYEGARPTEGTLLQTAAEAGDAQRTGTVSQDQRAGR